MTTPKRPLELLAAPGGSPVRESTVYTFRLEQRGHKVDSAWHPTPVVRAETDDKFLREHEELTGLVLSRPFLLDHLFSCRFCDAYPALDFDWDTMTASMRTVCPYPDGITTSIEFTTRSGRIVVTDDLRPIYDGYGDEDDPTRPRFASYNSSLGIMQATEEFARQGCAFGFVSNSSPDLFRVGDGQYIIANPSYTDDDEADWCGWSFPEEPTGLASVSTDIWSYSIADCADWISRGGNVDRDLKYKGDCIEFPPGVYRFTNYSARKGFDAHAMGPVLFADIRRIGD